MAHVRTMGKVASVVTVVLVVVVVVVVRFPQVKPLPVVLSHAPTRTRPAAHSRFSHGAQLKPFGNVSPRQFIVFCRFCVVVAPCAVDPVVAVVGVGIAGVAVECWPQGRPRSRVLTKPLLHSHAHPLLPTKTELFAGLAQHTSSDQSNVRVALPNAGAAPLRVRRSNPAAHCHAQDPGPDEARESSVSYSAPWGGGGQHSVWLRRTSPSQHPHCWWPQVPHPASQAWPPLARRGCTSSQAQLEAGVSQAQLPSQS